MTVVSSRISKAALQPTLNPRRVLLHCEAVFCAALTGHAERVARELAALS